MTRRNRTDNIARVRTTGMPMAKSFGQSAIAETKGRVRNPESALSPVPSRASNRAIPRSDQNRLAELKAKLGDEDYMNGAILRIATVLSARLTLR